MAHSLTEILYGSLGARDFRRAVLSQTEDGRSLRELAEDIGEVVYYVRSPLTPQWIKIGFTTNLANRLGEYGGWRALLAFEHGDRGTERDRLWQFHPSLAYGHEWFKPTPELVAHVKSIQQRLGVRT